MDVHKSTAGRIWEKKMTQSMAHNKAQLMNQAMDLISHGRITTTVPKAKVLKHYADEIVNIAKQNNIARLRKSVYEPNTTVPKLQLLAARYKDRVGGYTRLTLNGYNRPGSDRAPLATIEYVDNPKDSLHFLASKYLPKVKEDLKEIQARKYNTEEISLEDPMNPGTLVTAYRRTLRSDVNSKQIKQLAVKERYLQNMINKFERSLASFEKSRLHEKEYLKQLEAGSEAQAIARLELLQRKVDSMDVKNRSRFVEKFNAQQAAKNSIRVLKMNAAGDLFWEVKSLPEFAEVKQATTPEPIVIAKDTAKDEFKEDEKKSAPAKGSIKMVDRFMKLFRG
ncbi:ribosomal protein L17 [Obelidium mucronatum]|nr:ribosomal protein L17 [Obelidium mucronatum]